MKWIDENFKTKISKTCWLKLVDAWVESHAANKMTWQQISEKALDDGSRKRMSLEFVRGHNTYAGKWFGSDQTWLDLYFSHEYLYLLLFDYFQISRHTYQPIGFYERGNTIVDVGGSIFSAYGLLKYGTKNVLITNFDDSPQNQFTNFIADKLNLNVRSIQNNNVPENSTMVCSEYFEHFKSVDAELDRLLKFSPSKIYVRNSFCFPAYGHYIPIEIGGNSYTDFRRAQRAFDTVMTDRGFKLTKITRFFGKTEKYDRC